jgi:UDP-N-acetyl-D-mannosaminuronate dehydrogenase
MPEYVFNRIKELNPQISKVLILGATFKKGCDDTRNSLSFKMRKVCKKHGVEAYMVDPLTEIADQIFPTEEVYDAVIVMTPHDEFMDGNGMAYNISLFRKDCIIADVWKMFPESKLSNTGIYKVGDML